MRSWWSGGGGLLPWRPEVEEARPGGQGGSVAPEPLNASEPCGDSKSEAAQPPRSQVQPALLIEDQPPGLCRALGPWASGVDDVVGVAKPSGRPWALLSGA